MSAEQVSLEALRHLFTARNVALVGASSRNYLPAGARVVETAL